MESGVAGRWARRSSRATAIFSLSGVKAMSDSICSSSGDAEANARTCCKAASASSARSESATSRLAGTFTAKIADETSKINRSWSVDLNLTRESSEHTHLLQKNGHLIECRSCVQVSPMEDFVPANAQDVERVRVGEYEIRRDLGGHARAQELHQRLPFLAARKIEHRTNACIPA